MTNCWPDSHLNFNFWTFGRHRHYFLSILIFVTIIFAHVKVILVLCISSLLRPLEFVVNLWPLIRPLRRSLLLKFHANRAFISFLIQIVILFKFWLYGLQHGRYWRFHGILVAFKVNNTQIINRISEIWLLINVLRIKLLFDERVIVQIQCFVDVLLVPRVASIPARGW